MATFTPYHEGERSVQRRTGEEEVARRTARVIDRALPERALGFVSRQEMAVFGSLDRNGNPWASVLFGAPGFLRAREPTAIHLDRTRTVLQPHDPLWQNLEENARYGLLLIELESRRRLRVRGRASAEEEGLTFLVEAAYPNCPKYIQRRHLSAAPTLRGTAVPEPARSHAYTGEQAEWMGSADTFFVASAHPEQGVDASHRGGRPGFVEVMDERTLRIPDYPGNSMFNTLGNFVVHPRAGLAFPDFERPRTLQMIGGVTLELNEKDPEGRTGGTGRFWTFTAEEIVETRYPPGAAWKFLDAFPRNP